MQRQRRAEVALQSLVDATHAAAAAAGEDEGGEDVPELLIPLDVVVGAAVQDHERRSSGQLPGIDRGDGFINRMKEAYPDIEIIGYIGGYKGLLQVVMVMGLAFSALTLAFNQDWRAWINWFLGATLIYSALMVPRLDVHVTDRVNPGLAPATVDNVPIGLAAMASFTSQVSDYLTRTAETVFIPLCVGGGVRGVADVDRLLRTGADILLLDEISEGLAPVIVQALARMIRALKAQGFTIVMVEQNFRFAAPLADRFYVMEHGQIIEGFAASELQAKMPMLHEYLGV